MQPMLEYSDWGRGLDFGMLYMNYEPNASQSSTIFANAVFTFSNLPYRDDRGTYTVYFPFGGTLTLPFEEAMHPTHQIALVGNPTVDVFIDLPLTDPIINSFPSYDSSVTSLNPNLTSSTLQSLHYRFNRTTAITVEFQQIGETNFYSLIQSTGFLLLGIGLPLLFTVMVEIRNHRV
jgi:hypothetical protein